VAINYEKLKAFLQSKGYTVSEGPGWGPTDILAYEQFWKDYNATHKAVSTYDQQYALVFPQILVPYDADFASEVALGVLHNVPLWAAATKEDGMMYVGTDNDALGFQVSNSPHIQVALGIRYRHNDARLASDTGLLTFNTTDGSPDHPWVIVYSIATDGQTKLSDYDTTLVFTLDSTGAPTPELKIVYDAATNIWSTSEGKSFIVDDEGLAEQVTQNIQPSTLLSPYVLPAEMQSAPVPYGKYVMTLSSINKGAPEDQATIRISVKVTPTPVPPAPAAAAPAAA
jgi:hypothetical protein